MSKIKSKNWTGQPAKYAHLKLDGHWLRVSKNEDGVVTATTSHPTDITHQLPWLQEHVDLVPPGTVLLGELHVENRPASYVKSALKNGEHMQFTCFAIETKPVEMGLGLLDDMCRDWEISFAPWQMIKHGAWDREQLLLEAKSQRAEGFVMKNGNMLDWYKLKVEETIDLQVVDVTDGKGKFAGTVGALVLADATGRIVANASGMNNEERDEANGWIGKIVEVSYQYVGSGGRLRHPRFVRLRDDKEVADHVSAK